MTLHGPIREDRELFDIIDREVERQNTTLQLIASENFASPAVLAATGSVLTNKYSEGYPGKRYYGGNHVVDEAEDLARERAKSLFGADHANVQPHAGANANLAVYLALLKPGDTILGMSLDHGGHLTHGSPVNFSGHLYRFVAYGVTKSDERIDYDQIRDFAREHRPKLMFAGRHRVPPKSSIPRSSAPSATRWVPSSSSTPPTSPGSSPVARTPTRSPRRRRDVHDPQDPARSAAVASSAGPSTPRRSTRRCSRACRAARSSTSSRPRRWPSARPRSPSSASTPRRSCATPPPSPPPWPARGFRLVSGGTDNHLMLVDLRPFDAELTGKEAQTVLDRAGITLNKNTIPDDPRSPFVTSGVRIGTPATTTQGMTEPEMAEIARLIATRPAPPRRRRRAGGGPRCGGDALFEVHPYPESLPG